LNISRWGRITTEVFLFDSRSRLLRKDRFALEFGLTVSTFQNLNPFNVSTEKRFKEQTGIIAKFFGQDVSMITVRPFAEDFPNWLHMYRRGPARLGVANGRKIRRIYAIEVPVLLTHNV